VIFRRCLFVVYQCKVYGKEADDYEADGKEFSRTILAAVESKSCASIRRRARLARKYLKTNTGKRFSQRAYSNPSLR
jgi:hypothetical protein